MTHSALSVHMYIGSYFGPYVCQDSLQILLGMGFERSDATQQLVAAKNNIEVAIENLVTSAETNTSQESYSLGLFQGAAQEDYWKIFII